MSITSILEYDSDKGKGISPIIGVVLLVVITVAITGTVGFFVTNVTDDTEETGQAGVTVSETNQKYSVQLVNSGNVDEVSIRLNGKEIESTEALAGSISVSDKTQLCEGDTVTVIGSTSDSDTVLSSDTVNSSVDCQLQGATTTSTATYDGSSWIVETYIQNTSEQEQYYIVTLSNGQDQKVTDTVTLQPGESTTVTSTESSYAKSAPISVGVHSPDQSSSDYTLVDGSQSSDSTLSTTDGWSGGAQAGSYYYAPEGKNGTTVNSTDSSSSFTTSSNSSEPNITLSTSRENTSEKITLYAQMTTTEDPETTENLLVYATETNTSSTLVIDQKYTLKNGEEKTVTPTFSIGNAGQYTISATLASSDKIYEVGTVNVVNENAISISGKSISPSNPTLNKEVSASVDVTNSSSKSKTVTVELYENGSEFNSTEVTISANSTTTVNGSFTPTQEDLYEFTVGIVEPAIIEDISEVYISTDSSVSVSVNHSPTKPSTGETVTFTASADHSDSSVSIDEYQWSFDDGTNSTTTSNTYTKTFEESGQYIGYTVTAVASNGDSQTTGSILYVPYEGKELTPTTFVNNFDDGTYSDNWTVIGGSWSEDNGSLDSDSRGRIYRESKSAYGTWTYTYNHGNQYYGSKIWLVAIDTDGDKSTVERGYYISHGNSIGEYYEVNLTRRNPDGSKDLIYLGETGPGTYTIKVKRESDGTFTAYVDGSKKGTAQDSTYQTSEYIMLFAGKPDFNWYDLSLEKNK